MCIYIHNTEREDENANYDVESGDHYFKYNHGQRSQIHLLRLGFDSIPPTLFGRCWKPQP